MFIYVAWINKVKILSTWKGVLERLRDKHPAEALVGHARRTFCRGGCGSHYSCSGFAALISARQAKLGPPPRGWNTIM